MRRRIRVGAFALATVFAALAVPEGWGAPVALGAASPQRFAELSRQAALARESERLEDAIALYGQALRLRPSWEDGWWYLGALNYELDRHAEAARAFERLLRLRPSHAAARVFLGLCQYGLGDYRAALASLERGLSSGNLGTRDVTVVGTFHKGLIQCKQAQFEIALETLSVVARRQEDSPELQEALGLATLRWPRLPHELSEAERALAREAGRAKEAQVNGRDREAGELYRSLVESHPETPNVHYAYGTFLLTQDREAALQEFRREVALSPDHGPARLQLALEYLNRGQPDLGLPFAEEAVRVAPDLFPAHFALGSLLLQTGQTERAVRELETAVRLAPGSGESHRALAKAYAQAGRTRDAQRQEAEVRRIEDLRRRRAAPAGEGSSPSTPDAPARRR